MIAAGGRIRRHREGPQWSLPFLHKKRMPAVSGSRGAAVFPWKTAKSSILMLVPDYMAECRMYAGISRKGGSDHIAGGSLRC